MDYYRDSVTQASWQLLTSLKKDVDFVLIGGWAVWLYTKKLKSKDIDIIVNLPELTQLREKYELEKNSRLKKYQFRQGETEVDVYVPFFSDLGLPAEKIIGNIETIDGFQVPVPELLLVLKGVAWFKRRGSTKGRKDWVDIVSLLEAMKDRKVAWSQDWFKNKNVKQAVKAVIAELKMTIKLPELMLNEHQMKRLKLKWDQRLF